MCETEIDPRYLRALELLRNGQNNEDVIIGHVSEFSEKELSKMEDYLIVNNNIIITASSGKTHDIAKNLLVKDISQGILSYNQENSKRYISLVEYPVPYVDAFECGRIIDKRPDSLMMDKNDKSFPLVIEVAHGSESFKTLIIELLSYLAEFTHTIYAIGFFIDRQSDSFKARLIVLRRKLAISKDKVNALLEAIERKNENRHFEMVCSDNLNKQVPHLLIDFNKFISDNNAEIICDYEINETNMKNDVEFQLRASDFNGEKGKFINVIISTESIQFIRENWQEWKRKN